MLECHGFTEIGQRLHQLSLEGKWDEMGQLVTAEMLDAFAVVGEYDEIADQLLARYRGLVDEVSLSVTTGGAKEAAEVRRIIRQLQAAG